MGLGNLLGGGPSASKIAAQQEAARAKEQKRLEADAAMKAATEKQQASASAMQADAKRKAFVGGITPQEDETQRKRFLQGA